KRKIVISLLFLLGFTSVWGNNIRITGKPRVVNIVGDTAFVELNLSWDNSWRDDFNWDAAWIFLKYKKRGATESWHHGYLAREGHEAMPQSGNEGGQYTFMFGETGSGSSTKVTGVYLMRDAISEGRVNARLQLKWIINANPQNSLPVSDFGSDFKSIYVAVHAVEMVYIPYGSYYLGDAYSWKSFAVADTAPHFIDSENALTLTAKNYSPSVYLGVNYPKGYAGFYLMKYETSQEQYVEFLNALTLTQQKAHVTNNNFEQMKRGEYVFGDRNRPNNRNGIVFIEQKGKGAPAVFGNNLNPANDLFSQDDGQTLACNYLSPYDMFAYCDWSGLRPISELEYEKACRRPYPQLPEKGEYAWNTNSNVNSLNGLSDLLYLGDEREQATNNNKNVNSGNHLNGPVRCGLFATASTNQSQSGATYWGAMDMSGNLWEMCFNAISGASFIANDFYYSHGNGELYTDGATDIYSGYWPMYVGAIAIRGGCFNSPDSLLRTSARNFVEGNYFTAITQRDSTVGFRGARSLLNTTGFDGGAILCPNGTSTDTICVGTNMELTGVLPNNSIGKLSYVWYVSEDNGYLWKLIEGEAGADLKYADFINPYSSYKLYKFKRKVTCAIGEAETQANVYVAPLPWTIEEEYYTNVYPSFTVNSTWGIMPQTHWTLETPPAGISISDQGLVSGLTENSVFWTNVTVSSDKCPGIEYTKKLIIQRDFPVGSSSITLDPGEYVMECWGAEGGIGYVDKKAPGTPGKGGHSYGELVLTSPTTFYAYVGGKGGDAAKNCSKYCGGGWYGSNGGGWGGDDDTDDNGGGGGGASDIRLVPGNLYSRIMVAGGGGGARGGKNQVAGSGGGIWGGGSYGGGQTGSSTYFGSGADGGKGGNNACGGGGGGGGYYGASPAARNCGGGGSGFVSGMSGCNAITGDGDLTPTGQPNHYSGFVFRNPYMSNGNKSGNGLVRIRPFVP
uniref:glycine-rich protein n=1 Tax=Odoribacter lunatus TaxID=2941335 RepID=UPI00203F977C